MTTNENVPSPPVGQRARFSTPTPPAPVPDRRTGSGAAAARERDRSTLTAAPGAAGTGAVGESPLASAGAVLAVADDNDSGKVATDSEVVRAGGSMAVATLVSRITGFLRNLLIGAALGPAVASAFNSANTLPNLITEIVLGAVLTSLVVPVLIRAEKEDPDRGAAFFRRLFTLSASLLIVVTVLAVIAAPILTRIMLDDEGKVNVIQATSFAYLLLPQIFFYGIFALFMAVLNTKSIFKPGAWAPVANNVVSITVLVLYMTLPGFLNPHAPSGILDPHVMLLGAGTTLGVIIQSLIMLPYLKKAGVDLRPLWGIDHRLRQFGGMAMAIIVYVAISQVGYIVTMRIASEAHASAPNIYQQAWLLLQVPYGIIGVTLLTAIMPRLSRNAADGDDKAVVGDLNLASKLTFIALIPIVVFLTAFGPQIGMGLFAYRNFDGASATLIGLTLSFSAFTLIPYALVLLHLRVFYAREEAWTPTFIIAGITVTKIVLSLLAPTVATAPERVVVLLGAANGFGFITGAVIGALLLRRKLGHLGTRSLMRTTIWAAAASLVGVAVALLADYLLLFFAEPLFRPLGSVGFLLRMSIVGLIFLIVTGIALSFSRLPEVQNLGRVLGRIPGLSRIIRPDTSREIQVEEPSVGEMSSQLMAMDPFNASPVPPPMSAGVVRGPRLVPGAPVSDGRFRLLADHGSVPGARFWQAKELATGREVALSFVDTTGSAPMAPTSSAAAAGIASEVSRRTRKVAGPDVEALAYRAGCLIVADWVPGSSLKAVAESDDRLDPQAVALALAPLVESAARAHESNSPLGLDNRARIRISTDGTAVLAFPAVLPGASIDRDRQSIASALALLAASSTGLDHLVAAARAENADMHDLARELRAFAGVEDADDGAEEVLVVAEDSVPKPSAQPGFGSKAYSGRMTTLIALLAIGAVVLVATLTTYVASIFGKDNVEAPVTSDSLQRSSDAAAPTALPIILNPSGTSAPEVTDDDPDTGWTPAAFPSGVTIDVGEQFSLQNVLVQATNPGASFEIYPISDASSLTPGDAPRLAQGTLHAGTTTIALGQPVEVTAVLLWITEPAADGAATTIAEVDLVGTR